MNLKCDNKVAIEIAQNLVQHDRTKHVEIDRHFIKEKLDEKTIHFPFVQSGDQLADILTKAVSGRVFHDIIDKLGMIDIYAHNLRGSVGMSCWHVLSIMELIL